MRNRPVRDQWEFPSKLARHFPIKPGQPIGIALATVCFSSEFPNKGKEPLTIYMGKPEIPVGKSNGLLHSIWEALENMGCNLR